MKTTEIKQTENISRITLASGTCVAVLPTAHGRLVVHNSNQEVWLRDVMWQCSHRQPSGDVYLSLFATREKAAAWAAEIINLELAWG